MILIRVVDGEIHKRTKIKFLPTGRVYEVMTSARSPRNRQKSTVWSRRGSASFRRTSKTSFSEDRRHRDADLAVETEPLPGFMEGSRWFSPDSIPIITEEYENLRDAVASCA